MTMKGVVQLIPIIMAIVVAFILVGIGVYVTQQMGQSANISVLTTLANNLGTWATTWFPIILIVVAASIILALVLGSFGRLGRR